MNTTSFTEEKITHLLSERTPDLWNFVTTPSKTSFKPAAVLVPFVKHQNEAGQLEWHLLLTHRTDSVADHKGQVSFPGGQADPLDGSPEITALREANEEIGLLPGDVSLAGRLDQVLTISNFLITPVVGFIPWPYSFHPQPEEVSRVFTIPLSFLADPGNREIRQRIKQPDSTKLFHSQVICFKPYDGEILWGVSAEITLRLLRKLGICRSADAR